MHCNATSGGARLGQKLKVNYYNGQYLSPEPILNNVIIYRLIPKYEIIPYPPLNCTLYSLSAASHCTSSYSWRPAAAQTRTKPNMQTEFTKCHKIGEHLCSLKFKTFE